MKRIIVELDNGHDLVITPRAAVHGKIDTSFMDIALTLDNIEDVISFANDFAVPRQIALNLTCKNVDAVYQQRPPSLDTLMAAYNEQQRGGR